MQTTSSKPQNQFYLSFLLLVRWLMLYSISIIYICLNQIWTTKCKWWNSLEEKERKKNKISIRTLPIPFHVICVHVNVCLQRKKKKNLPDCMCIEKLNDYLHYACTLWFYLSTLFLGYAFIWSFWGLRNVEFSIYLKISEIDQNKALNIWNIKHEDLRTDFFAEFLLLLLLNNRRNRLLPFRYQAN